VRDIDRTRHRLDEDLRELETFLPAGATWAKRAAAIAVGGWLGTGALRFVLRRRRARGDRRRLRAIESWLMRMEAELRDGHRAEHLRE
jgi:hypothetical protein